MSSTIDRRVVEMRFDNQQFESRVSTTMGTLEKLKNALHFNNVGSGLDELDKKIKNTSFNPLSAGVEAVQVKFNALEVAAMTALSNIVNRAVNAGIEIAKSLSVDQISAGFSEYELKMGSIQTIMAGTGESLETVNKYLDDLNTYADKTIYSFSDMTSNIGKFTNAGVKLEDAVSAIQGVSNVAAVSGANANEASRAMYNFAQALSAGYVKLIDWKSIENANMATVEFKQQLIDTAVALGTVVKEGDMYRSTTTDAKGAVSELFDATSMFNDSLSHQWMSTEVLVQALSNYSTDIREMSKEEVAAYEEKLRSIGYTEEQIKAIEELGQKAFDSAQDVKTFSQLMDTLKESVGSGWAQTFEIIFGDFEEAKAMWTSVNEVVGDILQKQSDARNDLLKQWKELGGRNMLMGALSDAYKAFLKIANPVRRAFENIFPPITAKRLVDMTAAFRKFTRSLAISPGAGLKLQQTFEGLFSIIGLFGDVVKEVASFLKDLLVPVFKEGGSSILDFTADLGKNIKAFRSWVKQNDLIRKGLEAIQKLVTSGFSKIKAWFTSFKELPEVQEQIAKFKKKLEDFTATIREKFPNAAEKFDEFKASFKKLWEDKNFTEITTKLKSFASALKDDFLAAWEKVKSSELFTKFSTGLKDIWTSIKSIDTEKVSEWMKATYDSIKEFLEPAINKFKSIKDKLVELADNIKEGTLSIGDILADAAGYLKDHVGNILAALALFVGAAIVGKFVSSIFNLAKAIAAPVTTIVDAFHGFSQAAKGLKKVLNATALIEAVLAIGGLALLAVEIGKVPDAQIIKGTAIVGLMTLFVIAIMAVLTNLTKEKSKMSPKTVSQQIAGIFKIVELAAAIAILVKAFSDLTTVIASNDTKTLGIAVAGLVVAIGIVSGLAVLLKKFSGSAIDSAAVAAPVLAISGAVYILVQAFSEIVSIIQSSTDSEYEDIKRASSIILLLTGELGVIALALGVVSKLGGTGGSSLKIGGSILAIAGAVKLMASAFDEILHLDLTNVTKENIAVLVGIVASIGLLMVAISKMPASAGVNGAGLFAAAASIEVLALAIKTLSSLEFGDILQGIIAIGAMLTFLGIFTVLTRKGSELGGKSALAFLGLSAAILVLSGAVALMGLLSPEDVIIGTAAISALILSVGIMMGLASKSSELKLGTFAGLSIVIGVLTACVVALSFLDQGAVLTGTLAISALMICVGMMAGLMSVCDTLKLASFVGLSLIVLSLAESIRMIAQLESGVAKAVLTMAAMMILFGYLTKVLSTASTTFSESGPMGLVGIGLCVAIVAACAGVVVALASLDNVDVAVQVALALAALMAAVGIAMQGVAEVGQLGDWKKLGIGLTGLIAVIGVIALVLAGVTVLNDQVPGAQKALNEALPLFRDVGRAIGNVVGGLFEGFLGIDTSKLATQLSEFGNGMKAFAESASGISDQAANGVKAIAAMLLALAGGDLLNAITGLLGGKITSLSEFSAQLPAFGTNLGQFVTNLGANFKADSVTAAAAAGKDLTAMVKNLPTSGGWKEKILGEPQTMEEFSTSLMTFATMLKDFSSSDKGIGGLTKDQLKSIDLAADAGEKLIDLQGKLPDSGGFLQTILGEQTTLKTFGESLASFGTAIKTLADEENGLGGLTKDKVKCIGVAAKAAEALVDLQEKLPDEAGWFGKVFGGGKQDLDSFGEDAKSFAGAIKTVLSNEDGLGSLKEGSDACIGVAEDIVETLKGFVADTNFDSSNLKTLGKDIKDFGDKFKSFYDKISGISTSFLTSINSGISTLITTLSNELDSGSLNTFSDSLTSLATTGITNYCNAFTSSDTSAKMIVAINSFMTVALNAISSNASLFKEKGEEAIAFYQDAFSDQGVAVANAKLAISSLSSQLVGVLQLAESDFTTSGQKSFSNYIAGFQNETDAKNAATTLATNVVSGLASNEATIASQGRIFSSSFIGGVEKDSTGTTYASKAYKAAYDIADWLCAGLKALTGNSTVYGQNFSIGFINGITADSSGNSYATKAYNAAYSVGSWAVAGLKNSIDSNSPSKKAQEAGDYFGIGFVSQMLTWVSKAGSASEELGDEAVSSLNAVIQRIPDMLSADINMSPVLTPMVDLENAQKSAEALNTMFNRSIGISASIADVAGASVAAASTVSTPVVTNQSKESLVPGLSVQNNNQFHIESNNPDEVANRVSYILQKQVERKESVWGRSYGMGSPRVRSR